MAVNQPIRFGQRGAMRHSELSSGFASAGEVHAHLK